MKKYLTPSRMLWLLATTAVMSLIFYFSAQNANISSAQSGWVISTFFFWLPKAYASFIVRKLAHFTIYFALGFCMIHVFSPSAKKIRAKELAMALLLCFLYACSDEFHQSFTDGRAARFTDCLIDSSGSLCAMLVLALFRSFFTSKCNQKSS
jgi:hypothetical protein